MSSGNNHIDANAPDARHNGESPPARASLLAGVKPGAAATWAIALGLTIAALFIVQLFARPIALLLFGIVIAQALTPAVERLSRWMKRGIAIAVVYVMLLALLALIGWLVVPTLVTEGNQLVDRAPELYEDAQSWLEDIEFLDGRVSTDDLQQRVVNQIGNFGGQLVSLPITIFSTLFDVLLVLIISIYWIIAGPSLRAFALSLFPYERQGRVDSLLSEMGRTMGGYVRGVTMDGVVIGVTTFVGLSIIGVQYALVLAVIAAVLVVVPVVGPILTTVPIVSVALLDSPTTAIIALAFWIVVQQIESYLIMPYIMSSQADVPPLLALLAIYWGGSIGGILGALLAIPLSAALRVFFLRVVAPAIRRWTGAIDTGVQGPPLPPMSQAEH